MQHCSFGFAVLQSCSYCIRLNCGVFTIMIKYTQIYKAFKTLSTARGKPVIGHYRFGHFSFPDLTGSASMWIATLQ